MKKVRANELEIGDQFRMGGVNYKIHGFGVAPEAVIVYAHHPPELWNGIHLKLQMNTCVKVRRKK